MTKETTRSRARYRPTEQRAYRLGDAARVLGLSERLLSKMGAEGRIRIINVTPRARIVPVEEVQRILDGVA